MSVAKQKTQILKTLLILIWFLTLLHMVAEFYYLYWTFRWFDIVTHFLGGVWVGLGGLWLWFYSGYIRTPSLPNKHLYLIALFLGVIVGVAWEGFEYIVWIWSGTGLPVNYFGDTALDLCIDVVGALMGARLFSYVYKKHTK
jgi:hypothetical protein